MSDYTITTDFGAKDSLPSGNAAKIIKGSEFTTEFTNIKTAVNTKADTAGDTFTGAVTFDAAVTVNSTATITGDLTVDTNTLFVDVSENRVGIGTDSPYVKTEIIGGDFAIGGGAGASNLGLEIKGVPLSAIPSAQVRGYVATGDSAIGVAGDLLIAPRTNVNANVRFITGTSPTERMRIDSSGNVGIGTSSPSAQLHVKNNDAGFEVDVDNQVGDGVRLLAYDRNTSTDRNMQYRANKHLFSIGSSEKMRIDDTGNVGIGTNNPASKLEVAGVANQATLRLTQLESKSDWVNGDNLGAIEFSSADPSGAGSGVKGSLRYGTSGGTGAGTYMSFNVAGTSASTNDTERMRIDSSGNLLVGTTNANNVSDGIRLKPDGFISAANTSSPVMYANRLSTDGSIISLQKDGSTVGSISVTTSATAYNTSSDERLKENITDSADAGSKVDAIQIRQFDWKADGSHQDYGVIAQELATVAPEAVHQPEDSEDMMGVDYSKLVPMLIKEVQSLRSRVAQLENN